MHYIFIMCIYNTRNILSKNLEKSPQTTKGNSEYCADLCMIFLKTSVEMWKY